MEHDRQNFLSFWTIFPPFTSLPSPPLTTQKSKCWKNEKYIWRYHFKQVHQKSWSYAALFLRYNAWWIWFLFFILGYFLPFYPSTNKKIKIKKNEKNTWWYHQITRVIKTMMTGPEICCATDGRTDTQMEKVKYKSGCPT